MSEMTPEKAQALLDGTTPGPWRVGPVDDCMVFAPDRSEVADISGDYNDPDLWPIMEANARLIAAAPDLARAYIAQAAEIARLQARLEAAEKLAEAVQAMADGNPIPMPRAPYSWHDKYIAMRHHAAAALSAFQEGGK